MVDALLAPRLPRWEELNRAIDERDDMLDFAIKLFEHDRDAALSNYFQNGLEQFALVKHVAGGRWVNSEATKMASYLRVAGNCSGSVVERIV